MNEDSLAMFESIVASLQGGGNMAKALLEINRLKDGFLKNKCHSNEGYIMLKIMEYILDTLEDWNRDDSETTVYRRIVTIFDLMFRNTPVKLADEETTCRRTQDEQLYNEILFGGSSTDRQSYGRKIDLLISYGKERETIELSSNEFKRPAASRSQGVEQQNKNLRINGAILNHLKASQ